MKVGDLVEKSGATIRGPGGERKQLEEAPHYGVIIALDWLGSSAEEYKNCARVMWYDRGSGVRKDTTVIRLDSLIKISH